MEIEPGTKWVYSNHGFAALGQIVEDVTGQPLDRYMRERIFEPLGMEHTDLDPLRPRPPPLGHRLCAALARPEAGRRPRGPGPRRGRDVFHPVGRGPYIAALQRIVTGEHGPVLKPDTVASMFQPHFRLDPRLPGMGLAFELGEESGHRTVGKTGIVSGFLSAMTLAPDEGVGVVVLSNTGGLERPRRVRAAGWGAAPPHAWPPGRGDPHRHRAASRHLGQDLSAGTAPIPARSPTCSPEPRWARAPKSRFTAAI